MAEKIKIFGYQTKIEWYDVRVFFKQLLRKITYSWLVQELLCQIILLYMKLVFYSSKKIFVNQEKLIEAAKNKTPLIVAFWHNRLMMIPFVTIKPKKLYPSYTFMTLASRHGDGRFVGNIMEKFGFISILGSTKDKRKTTRGISFSSLKQILEGLKSGLTLGITPDGPRGPNQKINGEVINIARIAGAAILPASYSCSKFKTINTWDQFKIPLPFATLCFYFDEQPILVPKNCTDEELEQIKTLAEQRMNLTQEKSLEIAQQS